MIKKRVGKMKIKYGIENNEPPITKKMIKKRVGKMKIKYGIENNEPPITKILC